MKKIKANNFFIEYTLVTLIKIFKNIKYLAYIYKGKYVNIKKDR